jgi:hypothetical protein
MRSVVLSLLGLAMVACGELPEPVPASPVAVVVSVECPATDVLARRCMVQSNAAIVYDRDATGQACYYRCQ